MNAAPKPKTLVTCYSPGCTTMVDTDQDPDAVMPYPSHSVKGCPDIVVCRKCREREDAYRDAGDAAADAAFDAETLEGLGCGSVK